MISRLLIATLALSALPLAQAQVLLKSGPTQVGLLELYTSEGCNSCPPADRWLSTLTREHNLWQDFVPVAFHVDYWDYIGWKDRFAAPQFTQRQQAHAAARGLRTIYTPGFVLNGNEWRGWRSQQSLGTGAASAGNLTVTVDGNQARITYKPSVKLDNPSVYVALLGFGLTSRVQAGENAGRNLTHDFVVLDLQQMNLRQTGALLEAKTKVPNSGAAAQRLGIAVWVSQAGDPTPLQAVGGWLL